MFRVVKRDGKVSEFDVKKISEAIRKAFDACGRQYADSILDRSLCEDLTVGKNRPIGKVPEAPVVQIDRAGEIAV